MRNRLEKDCRDGTPFCDVHLDFIEAVQDLKTSVRWIVLIGGGLCTLGMALVSMQYNQWQEAEKVYAQVSVNQSMIEIVHGDLDNHLEGNRHGL